ncbi:hypothetical protein CHGG_04112 [Chaetomium globosum CBS 148.51]|uniref:Uncharacterized protein n=1 Tax=Chaetomium globosum (strain ATCC 6205 / CBS 148.51 / DSM 1962 / NBRC 6347 / NRRL 1970) TaxID=306901 RepID=Q2H284_CHAGB|nr:uncharacterized protein CHGG_04112 [Chaetomium globosum CBS 148.51]EAQ87493.1 hypothetical protein CHGG_04112 [Chaetomium globosum CBS 148.51]
MSLSVASTFARRGRPTKTIHPAALGSLSTAAPHHCQQTRGYKFGRLASYLESYIRPDIYTRHHSNAQKYCENLYRRRALAKHALAEDAKTTLKRALHTYWALDRRARHATGRCLNTDAAPRQTPDNPNGVRPGQNIEDAERAPLEHLLFGDRQGQSTKKNGRPSQRKADGDYVIDPITNRRVPNKSSKSPIVNHYGTPPSLLDALGGKNKDVRWHRNDTIASTSAPKYSDLHRYTAVRYQEPDGKPLDEQQVPKPADLAKYGPIRAHEPDGKYKLESESPANPEELGKYGAVRAHEPDGKYKDVPESLVESQELDKYGAVRTHEPDGKYKLAPETPVSQKELDKYGAVRSHEPDGRYKAEAGEATSSANSEELDKYGAFKSHEPDGAYKLEPEPTLTQEERGKYGAFRSHEPDGKYKLESEAPATTRESKRYEAVRSYEPEIKFAAEYTDTPDAAELAAYSKPILAHEPDGMYAANHVESEYDAEELAKYRKPFFSHEPDGKYAASYVKPQYDNAELSQYTAFRSHEPDGKYAASYAKEEYDSSELATYGAFRSHEPDGKYAVSYVEEKPDANELATYKAYRSHEPDGKYAASYVKEKPDSDELATYGAFRSHEPDGKYAASNAAPAKPADAQKYQAFRSHEPDGKYAAEAQASEAQDLANHEAFTYEDAETRPLPQQDQPNEEQEKSPYRKKVEELMARAAAESNVSGVSGRSSPPADSNNGRSQEPAALTGNYVRDFPEDFSKSWPAGTSEATSSLLSPEQKTSDGAVQPALERFGKETGDSSSKPANSAVPALYKILVYDPTMQCVEAAEMTSTVPDSTAALTPAEVLLRISNPAKFFPHFAPLQAQGFEIVAGSGDVLIFRKVHDGTTTAPNATVNRIDMTGGQPNGDYSVAAGRFASPTGFVNYDLPPAAGRQRAVAREQEEAADAASKKERAAAGDVHKKGKRSLPKKVAIGAACLTGSAYSVGVVSEYFKKGGVDGKGPKGL